MCRVAGPSSPLACDVDGESGAQPAMQFVLHSTDLTPGVFIVPGDSFLLQSVFTSGFCQLAEAGVGRMYVLCDVPTAGAVSNATRFTYSLSGITWKGNNMTNPGDGSAVYLGGGPQSRTAFVPGTNTAAVP
jgi:hypothetical protein